MTHQPRLLPVTIDGVSYQVDPELIERGFLPWSRQPIDTGREPGEQSLNPLGPWRKTISDWSLGFGQDFQDLETSSNRRYWTGQEIDISDRGKLKLAPDFNSHSQSIGTDGAFVFHPNNDVLWVINNLSSSDAEIKTTGEPRGTIIFATLVANTGYAVEDVTWDDEYVYLTTIGNGIKRTANVASPSAPANWSADAANTPERIAAGHGRLLGHALNAGDPQVVEIDGAGAITNVGGTDGDQARDIISTPNGFYIIVDNHGGAWGGSLIYFVGINQDTTLAAPRLAAELPSGDQILTGVYASSVMVFGTQYGLRLGVINADDTITFGPLVDLAEERAAPAARPKVDSMAFDRDRVVFHWAGMINTQTGLAFTGLGEALLTEFVSPLVPVVNQFQTTTVGADIFRSSTDVWHFQGNSITFLAKPGDNLWHTMVNNTTDNDIIYESTAEVWSGWIRYGITENKIPVAVDFRHEPLPTGCTVSVTVYDEDLNVIDATYNNTTAGSRGPDTPFTISGASPGQAFKLKLSLVRSTDTIQTPIVTSVTLYSIPVPARTEQFIMPLRNYSQVDDEAGGTAFFDPDQVYSDLRDLVLARSVITFELGSESYNAIVENVQLQREKNRDWDDDRSTLESTVWVTLQTSDLQVS